MTGSRTESEGGKGSKSAREANAYEAWSYSNSDRELSSEWRQWWRRCADKCPAHRRLRGRKSKLSGGQSQCKAIPQGGEPLPRSVFEGVR